jgi:hypothetical protein
MLKNVYFICNDPVECIRSVLRLSVMSQFRKFMKLFSSPCFMKPERDGQAGLILDGVELKEEGLLEAVNGKVCHHLALSSVL